MPELLGAEIEDQREREATLRRDFVNRAANTNEPHRGLESIFLDNLASSLVYEPNPDGFETVANLFAAANAGTPVIVPTLEASTSKFNRLHPNVRHRLAPILATEPVFIAGGSVLHSLTAQPSAAGSVAPRTSAWWGKTSDVDIFLHAETAAGASRISERIYGALVLIDEQWLVMPTCAAAA
jgi:hypothetical protein